MFTRTHYLTALIALSLAAPGYCESDTKSAEVKPMRTRVDGMKAYYEPGNVKKSGSKVTFKVYPSSDPTKDQGDEYSINCSTHDMASKEGTKEWSQPSPLLAVETMYPIAKKLCDWGPGFWQKLTD